MATKPAETNSIQGYQLCKRYEHAIQLLGKRWTGLILDTLMAGPRRFFEMTAAGGRVSNRVFSGRLREMGGVRINDRVVYPQNTGRGEYRLTEQGYNPKPVAEVSPQWC